MVEILKKKQSNDSLSLGGLKKMIFTVILLELFLGGTGRLTEITPFLTLRMILYLIYLLIIGTYLILGKKLPIEIAGLTILFIVVSCIALVNGFVNGGSPADIFEDIKPLLNTFLLCYLSFCIRTENDIRYVLTLLKISALILAAFHLVLCYIVFAYHDMALLFAALNPEDSVNTNFIFKGDNGFLNYPGDIYLCVGFIVWQQYHHKSLFKYTALFVLSIAIIATGTRGLIIGLAGAYLIKWLFLRFNYRSLAYMLAGMALFILVFSQLKDNIGDKDESDRIRYEQISEVKDRINPISVFIGHGFGIGVPVRPEHMEISYLEVFHKQGIIGLFYYLSILTVTYLAYKKCSFNNAVGFYMSVIFIFILSATNPYVNHPLGITVISIAIVSMLKIGELEKIQSIELYKTE